MFFQHGQLLKLQMSLKQLYIVYDIYIYISLISRNRHTSKQFAKLPKISWFHPRIPFGNEPPRGVALASHV